MLNIKLNGELSLDYADIIALIDISRLLKDIESVMDNDKLNNEEKYHEINDLIYGFSHTHTIHDISKCVENNLKEYIQVISRLYNQN